MKISEDITLKFKVNKNNSKWYWKPFAMFTNLAFVSRDGIWYDCSLWCVNEGRGWRLRISDLRTVGENSVITYHEPGLYKEVPVSALKRNLINFYLNQHPVNYKWYAIRKTIHQRRNTMFVFLASLFMTGLFHIGNEYTGGEWQRFVAENHLSQDFLILLSIFTFGSVFFPFTIRKELNEERVREMFKEEIEKHERLMEQVRRSKESASF